MINILARIKALYNDSKRYHWQCNGLHFAADHELFDRIADVFSNDVIDGLVEIYYMAEHREELPDLNDLTDLISEHEGYKFELDEMTGLENLDNEMFKELNEKIEELLPLIRSDRFSQAIMNKLDDLASNATQVLGLIKARITRVNKEDKVLEKLSGVM